MKERGARRLFAAKSSQIATVRALRPSREASEIDTRIWVRLLQSRNLILARLRKKFGDECTLARFDLMAILEREDGLTLAELSRRMLVTAGNLTGLVLRAERDGVVMRQSDSEDARLVRVVLTAKGRRLTRELVKAHTSWISESFSRLEIHEREELFRLLGKLRDSALSKVGRS